MDVIDYISSREQMLTTAEVASLLNLDPSTIMRWVNKGYLTACRFRNFHLFNPAGLADELRSAQRATPAGTIVARMQPDYVPVLVTDKVRTEKTRALGVIANTDTEQEG